MIGSKWVGPTRTGPGRVLAVGLALVASGVMGCAGDERLAPAPGGGEGGSGTTASSSSSSSASSTASTGAGTPVREVLQRNPFGDQTGNLLADGDFELSVTSNPGQQAWSYYGFQGQEPMRSETGGLCRSGLRCAYVASNGVLFGRGTAAAERAPMTAELWVKPLALGTCAVSAYVLDCDSFHIRGNLVSLEGPADDGWCALRANVAPSSTGICLYVDNDQGGPMLVDHASLRVREPEDTDRTAPAPIDVRAATRARMTRIRDHIRKTLPLGPPPPSADLDPSP